MLDLACYKTASNIDLAICILPAREKPHQKTLGAKPEFTPFGQFFDFQQEMIAAKPTPFNGIFMHS